MFLFDNILKFKVHFQSKPMLMQWLNEKNWIKSMYKKLYNIHKILCLWFMQYN
jgi:hypothetical protein